MKRAARACALLLAGCAAVPSAPGTLVSDARFGAAAVPGATRASVLAALGPTHGVLFDSGREVWLYLAPRAGGRTAEFVILFDQRGLVARTRTREPD